MKTAYPTSLDLTQYLLALGIVTDPATLGLLGLDSKASAAWQAFERAVDWRPYLAPATPTTRTFDHNGVAGGFELPAGLLSVTQVLTGVINGVGGTSRSLGTDYRLLPINAALDGLPYTRLQWGAQGYFMPLDGYGTGQGYGGLSAGFYDGGMFDPYFFGQAGQISITGVWGHTTVLDDDDWDAILQYAAYLCVPQIALSISKGLYSFDADGINARYGGAKVTPLSTEAAMWEANFKAKAAMRRRISIL